MKESRVLISGAGVAGIALAHWLRRFGFRPTIVERAAALRDSGYKVDIRGAAVDVIRRMGLLNAIRQSATGMRGATFVDRTGRRLATMDADLQNDPADIPAMLKLLNEGHDVVCGWRADRKDPAISRRLPSWLANRLIAWLSRVDLHDYGCTLRVYRREYVKGVPLYGEMHRFIPIYVTWAGAKVVELPVRHHARTRGVSKYGLSRVPKVLLDLTTVKFLRDFYVTPIYFFGWAGFAGLILGGAAWLGAIITYVAFDAPLVVLALALLGPILALFGVIEITLGIIAEVLIRMHYDIRDKAPYRIRSVWNLETAEEVVSPGEAV